MRLTILQRRYKTGKPAEADSDIDTNVHGQLGNAIVPGLLQVCNTINKIKFALLEVTSQKQIFYHYMNHSPERADLLARCTGLSTPDSSFTCVIAFRSMLYCLPAASMLVFPTPHNWQASNSLCVCEE